MDITDNYSFLKNTIAELSRKDIVRRIWKKDFTVWKPDPYEISNRLGWLNITEVMREKVPELLAVSEEVRKAGFRHVVLLGMGGSSLGSEVLCHTFGHSKGYPELFVLDSTIPESILEIQKAIDPQRTLFLVSSKSGTTIEPNCFMEYFQDAVVKATGRHFGQNFIAITDPGTPLVKHAEKEGFRKLFLNPPDLGGRYSVLSYFGLVPAALTGIDINLLIERAEVMRKKCMTETVSPENLGAWMGALAGGLAAHGIDKLTLMTSESVNSFGIWVEQLIAESTGKENKGIVPVIREPAVDMQYYGNDRFFVFLRMTGDNRMVETIKQVKASGRPFLEIEMKDKYDLGAEFFRWEFATSVAGAVLGVNPFDQPDVEASKAETNKLLKIYSETGILPQRVQSEQVTQLLEDAKPGLYLVIIAFMRQTDKTDRLFDNFRKYVLTKYHIATTMEYGPRYLHSIGQLHKGGPNKNLTIQVVTEPKEDIPIPGKPYSFGILAKAQAFGDMQTLESLGRHVAITDMESLAKYHL